MLWWWTRWSNYILWCFNITSLVSDGKICFSQNWKERPTLGKLLNNTFVYLSGYGSPCIWLAWLKFELTNLDSVSGKSLTVLTSSYVKLERHWNRATFLARDGIKNSRKGIYNSKTHIRWQKGKKYEAFGVSKLLIWLQKIGHWQLARSSLSVAR